MVNETQENEAGTEVTGQHDAVVMLPTYESDATPEEQEIKLKWMYEQIKFIRTQEKDDVPVSRIKLRCGCHKLAKWQYMYRCLYCGVWYCKECAEEHFGAKVPEPFQWATKAT
jgi:hypothetical protein